MTNTFRRCIALLVTLTLALLTIILIPATSANANPQHDGTVPQNKVDVCKYVGTPHVDERLQTGNNPIEVSVNSIKGSGVHNPPQVGDTFADGQGRSVVVATAGMPRVTDVSQCPAAEGPGPSIEPTSSTPTSSTPTSSHSTPVSNPTSSTVTVPKSSAASPDASSSIGTAISITATASTIQAANAAHTQPPLANTGTKTVALVALAAFLILAGVIVLGAADYKRTTRKH